jgi:hypothetical protein
VRGSGRYFDVPEPFQFCVRVFLLEVTGKGGPFMAAFWAYLCGK